MVKISIITVSYNAEKTIENTILSVINQNYDNYEYIIIDGGSKDRTLDIVKKYKDKIDLIISEKDDGIYDAMNKGVKYSMGDLIFFLNADDRFYDNNVLLKIAKIYKNTKADIMVGDIYRQYLGDNKLYRKYALLGINYLKRGIMPPHQGSFVKRKWLVRYKFDLKYRSAADFDFFCNLFKNKVKYIYVSFPISIMLMSGYSMRNLRLSYYETEKIVLKHFGYFYYYLLKVKHFIFYNLIKLRNLFNLKFHFKY